MIRFDSDSLVVTSICMWLLFIVFVLILLFATLSFLGTLVALFVSTLSLSIALVCTFLSIVDVDDLMEWNRERKIAKFKGEN